jgi:hypothetical protein
MVPTMTTVIRGNMMTKEQAERIKIQADNCGYTDIQVIPVRDSTYGTPTHIVLMSDIDGNPVRINSPQDWEVRKEVQ